MFVRDRLKLLFIHPPKTGGMSIGTFILNNNFRYTQEHLSDELKQEYFKYGNHHVDSKLIPDIEYDYSFSVFRDPLERFKSAYKNRFFNEFSFEDFVEKSLLEYDDNSSDIINQFIKPQVRYYTKKCEVFLFENLTKIPLYLNKKGIEMQGTLSHLNKSKDLEVNPSPSQIEKIKNFYREDYSFSTSLS